MKSSRQEVSEWGRATKLLASERLWSENVRFIFISYRHESFFKYKRKLKSAIQFVILGLYFLKTLFSVLFLFCFFWFLVSNIQKSNIHLSFALFFTSSYFFRVIILIHVYSFFNIVCITNNVFILFWSIKRMLYTCSS